LELAGGRRVRGTLPLRQGVPPGGAAALARRGELAGRGVVVALRRGELTRLRRVRPALLVRRSAEDVTPHVRAAVLPAVRTGPLELAGVLAAVRAGPGELARVLRVRGVAVDAVRSGWPWPQGAWGAGRGGSCGWAFSSLQLGTRGC